MNSVCISLVLTRIRTHILGRALPLLANSWATNNKCLNICCSFATIRSLLFYATILNQNLHWILTGTTTSHTFFLWTTLISNHHQCSSILFCVLTKIIDTQNKPDKIRFWSVLSSCQYLVAPRSKNLVTNLSLLPLLWTLVVQEKWWYYGNP